MALALLGAGLGFLGSMIDRRDRKKTNKSNRNEARRQDQLNWARQQQVNRDNRKFTEYVNQQNRDHQTKINGDNRAHQLFINQQNRGEIAAMNEKNRLINQVAEAEAAGINPLYALNTGAFVPHQASLGSASVGQASGGGVGAPSVATQGAAAQAAFGDEFANGFNAIANGLQLHHENQLRETALAQENEQLREAVAQLANPPEPSNYERYGNALPIPDPYGGSSVPTAQTVAPTLGDPNHGSDYVGIDVYGSDNVSSGFVFPDRLNEVEPNKDVPSTTNFTTPLGNTYPMLNPEVVEEGPAAWLNSMWAGYATAIDPIIAPLASMTNDAMVRREWEAAMESARNRSMGSFSLDQFVQPHTRRSRPPAYAN